MRLGTAILTLAAAIWLSGCSLRKPATAHAAPPPPKPAAPAKPAEPLSTPQTTVELPPPQPVPPDALPPAEPGTPPSQPTTTRPTTRPAQSPRPARTEPTLPVGPPAPPVETPPPDRQALGEVIPAAEAKRLQDEAHGRMQETRQILGTLAARRLNAQQRSVYRRIETFLNQAEEAERRGDMRQASELAGRAQVLARELKP